MIRVEYGLLPKESFYRYFKYLTGRVYKILPLKEEGSNTLISYIESLQRELIGNINLVNELIDEPQFISILNIIQYLISEEYTHEQCKKEVFRCIKMLDNIQMHHFSKGRD